MEKNMLKKSWKYALLLVVNIILIGIVTFLLIEEKYNHSISCGLTIITLNFLLLTFMIRTKKERNVLWEGLLVIGTLLLTVIGSHILIEFRNNEFNYIIVDLISSVIGIALVLLGQLNFYIKDPIENNQEVDEEKEEPIKIVASEEELISFKRELNGFDVENIEKNDTKVENKFKVKKISSDTEFKINHLEVENLREKLVSIMEYVDLLNSRKEKLVKENKYNIPFLEMPIEYGKKLIKKVNQTIDAFLSGKKIVLEDHERLMMRPNSGYDLEYMIKKIKREPKLMNQVKLEAKNFNFYSLMFKGADFSNVYFDDAFIINASFEDCNFENNKLKNLIIKNSQFNKCFINNDFIDGLTAINTSITNTKANNTKIKDAWFSDSNFNNFIGTNNNISNSKLIRSKIKESKFQNTSFKKVYVDSSSMDSLNFEKSQFNILIVNKGDLTELNLTNTILENITLNNINKFSNLIFSSSFIESKMFANIKINNNQDLFVKNIYIKKDDSINKLGDLVQYQLLKTYTQK